MDRLIILLIVVSLFSCQKQTSEQVETQQDTQELISYASYGDSISADGYGSVMEIEGLLEGNDSVITKVEGTILATCQMKGCWMDVDMGDGKVMKVTFKDYGFFVPKEGMEGKTVILEGVASKELVDVETLQHYAEDAGKDAEAIAAITEPELKLSFEASGVLIKN